MLVKLILFRVLSLTPVDCLWFQCKEKVQRCTCNGVDVQNSGGDDDHRTVGLAGATGALGGALAAGSALAAYFHFRGGGGGGGGRGGGGDGTELVSRGGRASPRPGSTGSNAESYSSESPLTKRDSGDSRAFPSRFRPFTGTSSVTNIYRHSKVWPGRHA